MEFDPANSLPYLISGIFTSIGLILLIHSYVKGIKRIKNWIIAISFHNMSLYVRFVDNGFFNDKYSIIHILLSGVGLLILIYISMNEYLAEFPLDQQNERKKIIFYVIFSITIVLIYILILHQISDGIPDLATIILYPFFMGLIFANIVLIRLYKEKQTPTHLSMVIVLMLIGLDIFFTILDAFIPYEIINFRRIFEAGEGIGFLFFGFNISFENQLLDYYNKLKQQNQLLKQTQDQLISQTQLSSIQIIAGGFAHDFNNILTSIIGNVNLIEDYPIFQGEGKEFIDDLTAASSQAKNMVNQLLVFSKGEEFLNKEIIAFTDIIEITTKFSLRGKKSRPLFDIDEDLWSIYGDPIQISQIIQNLVINADQAMLEGGIIELKAHNVELGIKNQFQLSPGKYIHFRIIDTGVGIPQDIQEKIFSPFFTTKRKGKGLGLSICKKILEDHQGYMGFNTTIGKGTEFYFYAPAREKITKRSMKQDPLKVQFSGSALILDDNFLVLRVIENLLRNLGMTAISSSESSTFLITYEDMIKKGENIDLLIVDLTLPGDIGGKAIIKKIRNINPDAYVIVSSGYSEDFVMKNYRDYGFNDFLRKPYNKEELVKVLKNCFQRK